jgi:hypothetical protein
VELDEEVPPPYVVAEPERTLDRGPSARETNRSWPDRRGREDVNMHDLSGGQGGSISKPPGYEEADTTTRGR